MFRLVNKIVLLVFCVYNCLAAKTIPPSLKLGAGSSAYQIEGGWDEDGKGLSIWDVFTQFFIDNGKNAADSYHKWREDVDNIKRLGLDFYRFSISWPRILPDGTLNEINQKGVDYYMNIIQALKEEGIEPVVTIYHWDMPQHISLLGGFLNVQFVDYFGDYARLLFKLFGPYVKHWLTINEPYMVCKSGYGSNLMAPGLNLAGDGVYQCSYVLLKAHAKAYRIYDEEFKSLYNGKVSIVLNSEWKKPSSNSISDIEAQERALQFALGWFANPIYLGNWPPVMIDRIANRSKLEGLTQSRLPEFTPEEIDYIKGTHDFFALNSYGSQTATNADDAPISKPDYEYDRGVNLDPPIFPIADPSGLRKLLKYVNDRYDPKEIFITESGVVGFWDTVEDTDRVDYLKSHISVVMDCIMEDNLNITSYSIWSLIDDFEWFSYIAKYGLIRVDFSSPNKTRTWKNSAYWYQNLTATRILDV